MSEAENLWRTAEQSFDQYPRDKLARAYVHHHQMANAIIDFKGGDGFSTTSRTLHCGVRKVCETLLEKNDKGEMVACGVKITKDVRQVLKYQNPVVTDTYSNDTVDGFGYYHLRTC